MYLILVTLDDNPRHAWWIGGLYEDAREAAIQLGMKQANEHHDYVSDQIDKKGYFLWNETRNAIWLMEMDDARELLANGFTVESLS